MARLTDELKEKLVSAYLEGKSLSQIRKQYNVHNQDVYNSLKWKGISPSRGKIGSSQKTSKKETANMAGKNTKLTDEQKKEIVRMFTEEGKTREELAKIFNTTELVIKNVLAKDDLDIAEESDKLVNTESIAKKVLAQEESKSIRKVVENLGTSTAYKLYRFEGTDRNFIGKFTEKEIEAYHHDFEVFLQKNFGGGHYDVEVYGTDQATPIMVKTYKIEGEPKKPDSERTPVYAEPNRLIIKEIERRDEEFRRREEKYESMLNKIMEEMRRKDEEIERLRREMIERKDQMIEKKIEEIKEGKQTSAEILAEAIRQLPTLLETFKPKLDTQFKLFELMLEMKKLEEERLQREREIARQEFNRLWDTLKPQKNPELIELKRDLKDLQRQLSEPAVDPLTETMKETLGELLKNTVENMTKQPPVTTGGVPAVQGGTQQSGVIGQVISKLVEAIPAVSESISKAIKEKAYIQRTGRLPGEQPQTSQSQQGTQNLAGNFSNEAMAEIQKDSIRIAGEVQKLYIDGAGIEQIGEYLIEELTKLGNQSKNWEVLISKIVDNPETNLYVFDSFFTGFDPEFKKSLYSYLLKRIEEEKGKTE